MPSSYFVSRLGSRNLSGGYNQKYAYSVLIHLTKSVSPDGFLDLEWNRLSTDQNCTINSIGFSVDGQVEINFSTNNQIFGGGHGVVEYQDSRNTDFRE